MLHNLSRINRKSSKLKEKDIPNGRKALENLSGIGDILDRKGQAVTVLDHERSGELVIIAKEESG